MSESLEKAFLAYYKTEKRKTIILSIACGCGLLVILALHFVLSLPLSRWWIIFVVLIMLSWTKVAVIKYRINKKWFATNEDASRLISYDDTEWKEHTENTFPRVNLSAQIVDGNNELWFGTVDAGIIWYDGATYETYTHDMSDQEIGPVTDLYIDGNKLL